MAINLSIHPMWVIDEYAIIVRKWDWLIPNNPPIKELIQAIQITMFEIEEDIIKDKMDKGANFCHEDRRSADNHEIEVITEGYHKWQGNIPSFSKRLNINNKYINLFGRFDLNHRDILDIIIILDPTAWAKKYLIDASDSCHDLDLNKIGIKDKRLSSIDIHRKIQFVLDIAISELVIIIDEDIIINGVFIDIIKAR
jgi:hypothetical protein